MFEPKSNASRFPSQVKKRVVPLKGHMYINPADPQYYEKVLQYVDRHDPEALFHVGMKQLRLGNPVKGKELLMQCSGTRSGFAAKARSELRRLEQPTAGKLPPVAEANPARRGAPWGWIALAVTLTFMLAALLLLGSSPARSVIARLTMAPAGMDVIYETAEQTFLIYVDPDKTPREVEQQMYEAVTKLGRQYPDQVVKVYGVYAGKGQKAGTVAPLRDPGLKSGAFVMAKYHAATGENVTVRFFSAGASDDRAPYVRAGANLVRTALEQYREDHGKLPDTIRELLGDYPDNYLSWIPIESASGSANIADRFDGSGGWVYTPEAEILEQAFRPNTVGIATPYAPVEIIVSKSDYRLYVASGEDVLEAKQVGLGREDSTAAGSYEIDSRVLEPEGAKPGMYGDAGLGFGSMALHGTLDRASIGENRSLGCVRLWNEDIMDIFPIVPKGAAVRIVEGEAFPSLEEPDVLSNWEPLLAGTHPGYNETAEGLRFEWLD
ncbi:L,D-transpeptidase [Paenibacillus sp.]|uniref:L,D-transpeptidase n=1 Tax=Paenibacillus sp. TaxID=58172 RepID=UPI002D6F3ED4|nr:L,D-transpeptidase [Paenibacillus sp.]HZG84936.1 L,D-transpeptidase [Paenibacillus sp.]